jgi:chromatin assembly factor 1 subunit B
LVSCSTDNTAIVFDTVKDKKVKILGEHKGWVNGVAWDPKDQSIASIASDR